MPLLVLFYTPFILLLSLFHTNRLVSTILFNHDYLNSTAILLCLCFYSLYCHFVNLNFICSNNNLCIRLSFHFTYDIDEEIRDVYVYIHICVSVLLCGYMYSGMHVCSLYTHMYMYIKCKMY